MDILKIHEFGKYIGSSILEAIWIGTYLIYVLFFIQKIGADYFLIISVIYGIGVLVIASISKEHTDKLNKTDNK